MKNTTITSFFSVRQPLTAVPPTNELQANKQRFKGEHGLTTTFDPSKHPEEIQPIITELITPTPSEPITDGTSSSRSRKRKPAAAGIDLFQLAKSNKSHSRDPLKTSASSLPTTILISENESQDTVIEADLIQDLSEEIKEDDNSAVAGCSKVSLSATKSLSRTRNRKPMTAPEPSQHVKTKGKKLQLTNSKSTFASNLSTPILSDDGSLRKFLINAMPGQPSPMEVEKEGCPTLAVPMPADSSLPRATLKSWSQTSIRKSRNQSPVDSSMITCPPFTSPKSPSKVPPTVIDLSERPSPKPTKTFLTFAEMDKAREQKRARSMRTAVDASWPQPGESHNRTSYLEQASTSFEYENRPRLQKGKRPLHHCTLSLGQTDFPFKIESEQQATASAPLPSLSRLDLVPPTSLISGLTTNPVYRHPLIMRLVGLFKPLPGQSLTHDHPLLRRQHHRSPDSASQLWSQKYAPKRAKEMLGEQNAASAQILRCWLKEVEVRDPDRIESAEHLPPPAQKLNRRSEGIKTHAQTKVEHQAPKRIITRKVDRKPRKKRRKGGYGSDDYLDDFIVDDDDEDTIYSKDIQLSDLDSNTSSEPKYPTCAESHSPRKRLGSVPFAAAHLLDRLEKQAEEEQDEIVVEFEQLTNLMLLQGPNGCGKTSAVYAVAAELGWDVFELNPGVLRNRKEINRLVGDVARNHVLPGSSNNHKPENGLEDGNRQLTELNQSLSSTKASGSKNPFAGMMKAAKEKPSVAESKKTDRVTEKSTQAPPTVSCTPVHQKGARQTLILLDEADIVYGQDRDFWPAVVELISTSMRPVVMTCNDAGLIPLDTLPIQQSLEFSPPPPSLTAAWLQVLGLLEGHLLETDALESFYVQHVYRYPFDCPPNPTTNNLGHPIPTQPPPARPDLRRTLIQLQFWCQWAVGCRSCGVSWLDLSPEKETKMLFSTNSLPKRPIEQDESDMTVHELLSLEPSVSSSHATLDSLCEAYESRSFVDAYVDRRIESQLCTFEYDRPYSKVDEQLSSGMIVQEIDQDFSNLERGELEREIALMILRRLPLDQFDELSFGKRRLDRLKQLDQSTEFLPLTAPLLPNSILIIDYGPWIRLIVKIEDELESLHNQRGQHQTISSVEQLKGKSKGLRISPRLNGFIKFQRKFQVDRHYLEIIRQSGFIN
ncbi:hypothetical protein CROQUDRAFT_718195 [Cronartium quercuum f. sp. fusiforme G11]|uniref:AAA+ ATPase domain-containing protein n=1 Tax=Cronartium quercuum f. sp. fusiforme G11 TaxID=708437 RepID=A0A9P6NBV4_9BASI|nr:hypothetical protein CROQUDRAFT_718195 [Cronartium quercuum f. sp. fusiforme G11]